MKKSMIVLMVLTVSSLAMAGTALAQVSNAPDPGTVQTNGRVSAVLAVGDRVYLAGTFTQVTDADGTVFARNRLAAVDATNGRLTGWDPSANGPVGALAASADGTRVYAGGSFTVVGGVARRRLVSLDAATGAADGRFRIGLDATVRAIAVRGARVYIGGDFVSVKGQNRPRLALIDGITGDLDPSWIPAADGTVRALTFSPEGTRLYAGGDFTTMSGRPSPHLAGLDAAGAGAPVWQPLVNPNGRVYNLAASGGRLYSAEGGPGGAVASYDAGAGAKVWSRHGDGDVQAVAALGNKVYIGGHFLRFGGQDRRFFAAVDAITGRLDAWNPSGAGTGSGVWSLAPSPPGTRVYAGGDFMRVSGQPRQHFAQFSDLG